MLRLHVEVGRVVLELGDERFAIELVVPVVAVAEERANRGERAVQTIRAAAQPKRLTTGRELRVTVFDERDAVLGGVVAVVAANVGVCAGPRRAKRTEAAARLRVVDRSLRCVDIARPPATARRVHGKTVVAPEQVGSAAPFCCRRSDIERRAAVRTVDRLRWHRVGDHVDEPADGIRTIEQRRRPAHDFNLRRTGRVQRNPMIARLARQITDALTIFKDQHAVAIQPADHWPRRSRSHRALGHARLGRQRGAQRAFELP